MFTGMIENMGSIKKMTRQGDDAVLDIETSMKLDDIHIGDSIAINGACLTVTRKSDRGFMADVSAETLSRTNLKVLKSGDPVNLEKSLRLNSFLGGHLVLGHVDGLGKIIEKMMKSHSILFGLETDTEIGRLIVEKGSVAVDGVSLTVNHCEKSRFYVSVIPQTARMTTLGVRRVGERVNIETDIIGKYVDKLLNSGRGIDMNFLKEHGFK